MILGIYGSGGAGREVMEIAAGLRRWDEVVFIDDTVPEDIFKGIHRMPFTEFQKRYDRTKAEIIIAQGEPQHKVDLYNRVKEADYRLANVIHPLAIISESANLGEGIIVKPGAIVSADAVIGDNVSIEEYAVVAHDCIIHNHVQISAFVMLAGRCEVGEASYIAVSVPIRERVKIGCNTVVGMGSVVLRDMPDNVIVVGNPASPMRKRTDTDKVFRKNN